MDKKDMQLLVEQYYKFISIPKRTQLKRTRICIICFTWRYDRCFITNIFVYVIIKINITASAAGNDIPRQSDWLHCQTQPWLPADESWQSRPCPK